MHRGRLGPILLLPLALVVSACDDPTLSSSITRTGSSPTAVLNLTGAWAGTATDSGGQVQMVWQLTQRGANVTGTVRATNNVGLQLYTGSVAATLAASILTFTVTVPSGSISDLPDCSIALSGSATDVQASSMSGTYTGIHSCLGAMEGGRLILIKQ